MLLFVLFLSVLILFVGLAIDLGFAYVTKARLSKALDAASLAAVSNYSSSDNGSFATAVAEATFHANFATNGLVGRGTTVVNSVGHFTLNAATGVLTFTNTASVTLNTFFIGILPQWKTLNVGDTAVANRSPVVMTLVLDRSGSMKPTTPLVNCTDVTEGGKYLPGAVTNFINIFDESLDQAALVTFSTQSFNDLPMTKTFKTGAGGNNIPAIVKNLNYAGGTCSMAGLTNALVIQNSVNAPNAVKAVVFFTDGQANTILGKFNGKTFNFGGNDPPQIGCNVLNAGATFWATNNNGNQECTVGCGGTIGNCGTGNIGGVSTYTDLTGPHPFCADSITLDATNRCVLLAQQMRASGNYVYAIGLTAQGALQPPTLQMLQIMANDPNSPNFDPTIPVGAAFQSTGQDLTQVFQQVAADIILRLVQ